MTTVAVRPVAVRCRRYSAMNDPRPEDIIQATDEDPDK